MLVRYLVAVVIGGAMTLALFFIMQALIKSDRSPFTEGTDIRLVEFVRLQEDEQLEVKQRKPEPPPPPDEPPPNAPQPSFDAGANTIGVDIGQVEAKVDLNMQGTGGFSSDGEYLPIVKVAPVYPRRAQTRGIEGYVLLEFTVTRLGTVIDPVVVEADPPGIFDRAAIQAALKFKYKPKVINGEAVEVAGVRNLIKFELEDGT